MKIKNESGSERTNANNTLDVEILKIISGDENEDVNKAVLIQINFYDNLRDFHKTIEIVSDLENLKEQIEKISNEEYDDISYDEEQNYYGEYYLNNALAHAKFYLISPFTDYSLKCKYFVNLVVGFGRIHNYISKNPNSQFKIILDIDINKPDYFRADLKFIPISKLDLDEILKFSILGEKEIVAEMTLKSKLQFFSRNQIEILKIILTVISNGNFFIYSHVSSNGANEDSINYNEFTSVFNRLYSFYITKETKYSSPDEPIIPIFYNYDIFRYFNLPTDKILNCHLINRYN